MERSLLALGAISAVACAAPSGSRGSTALAEKSAATTVSKTAALDIPLRPDQILGILERSQIMYDLDSGADVQATDITSVVVEGGLPRRPVDPFFEVIMDPGGRRRLKSSRPPSHVAPLFRDGDLALAGKDFRAALSMYTEAVAQAPEYFKAHTYLGNTHFYLGQYRQAEQSFLRALELNPLDYQAYLFLGQTYVELGQPAMAKRALVRAFMLNRSSDTVKRGLAMALAPLQQRIRDGRLSPRIRIARDPEGRVRLQIDKQRGLRWLALATCLACWAYEDACSRRGPASEDPLRLAMYRECLINQAASIAIRNDRAGKVGPDERVLLSAIEDGFLDAIVIWEVVARRLPAVVLLLPEKLRTSILEYIDRYVIVSARVATLGLE